MDLQIHLETEKAAQLDQSLSCVKNICSLYDDLTTSTGYIDHSDPIFGGVLGKFFLPDLYDLPNNLLINFPANFPYLWLPKNY